MRQLNKVGGRLFLSVCVHLLQLNHLFNVSSFGLTLMDNQTGPFRLEVAWLGVYYDRTHFEKFAYELYDLPQFVDSQF